MSVHEHCHLVRCWIRVEMVVTGRPVMAASRRRRHGCRKPKLAHEIPVPTTRTKGECLNIVRQTVQGFTSPENDPPEYFRQPILAELDVFPLKPCLAVAGVPHTRWIVEHRPPTASLSWPHASSELQPVLSLLRPCGLCLLMLSVQSTVQRMVTGCRCYDGNSKI